MRRALFALIAIAIAGPAIAQDDSKDTPAAVVSRHKSLVHLRTAAIQAPAPVRPRAEPAAPSGKISQKDAQANPALVLQQFTLADLQAALADAQGQTPPDTIAANCYQALITVVMSPAVNPLPAGPGAFQLFQKARDLKNIVAALQSNQGPLTQLNVACAPLVLDAQTTLIRLGIIGGGIAASGGLLPLPLPIP